MPDNQRPPLLPTIVKLYRTYWRLFWCIMLPVAIVAIALDIAQFFYLTARTEKDTRPTFNTPSRLVHTATHNINTISGIEPTIEGVRPATADTSSSARVYWISPVPFFRATDGKGTTWEWKVKFKSLDYGAALVLLLLTLCPLSLAVARILGDAQVSEGAKGGSAPAAREVWRQTGRKAFTVFVATLLFLLLLDVGNYLYMLISWLMPSHVWRFPFELTHLLMLAPYIYFMVTLSLYNPCLILENTSIIGIFRRSHALVSGARFYFFGVYLLTGWIAAVITSVLFGVALLVFSVFIPDLAPVSDALFSLKFFSLFIGADVEVVLPQVLNTPVTVAILITKGLIATFLVPIWAILTTRLYLKNV